MGAPTNLSLDPDHGTQHAPTPVVVSGSFLFATFEVDYGDPATSTVTGRLKFLLSGYELQDVRFIAEGKVSAVWYERPQPNGFVGAEIQFKAQCKGCPARAQCAPGKSGRTLSVNPYHEILGQRRAEQETEDFKERMKHRPAVEGTISELTRAHGARRSRYRGLNKVRLQALFTGAAANLKRLTRALAAKEKAMAKGMAAC